MFIKGDKVYRYRGDRSIEAFVSFALENGYKTGPFVDDIPQKLEGFDLYKKQFGKFLQQLIFAIEQLFAKIGLEAVPRTLKVTMVGSLFFLPFSLFSLS